MRQRTIRTLGLAAATALLTLAPAVSTASAAPKRTVMFKPAKTSTKTVTFRVRGVKPRRVVRAALLRDGRVRRRIGRVRARHVARSGVLRAQVRAPRAVRLKVVTVPAPRATATQPAPADVQAGETATTRPVGSPILSDAEAASHVRRSSWEPRPENAAANQRTPQPGELDTFLSDNTAIHRDHKPLVTGNFTGTTDEIIQWAAWKWGLDEDILRAVAVSESYWRSSAIGDGGLSFGMTQIKITYHAGTQPLSSASTAFNLDYYGALFRYYFEGHATWLNDVTRGHDYAAGDLWGAVGTHYAGRWYTAEAESYISKVKTHLENRTWREAGF